MLKLLLSELTRPFRGLTGFCMHNNHVIDQHVVGKPKGEVRFLSDDRSDVPALAEAMIAHGALSETTAQIETVIEDSNTKRLY